MSTIIKEFSKVNIKPTISFLNTFTVSKQYLSFSGESDGVMGATGHLGHPLINEVGGNQGRDQAVVGGAISQLAVTIVTPSIHLSFCIVNQKSQTAGSDCMSMKLHSRFPKILPHFSIIHLLRSKQHHA